MYYSTGDISTADNDATYCMFFNKQLVEDYNLGYDFYSLVKDGKWTFDVYNECVSTVHKDLDGDGSYNNKDTFGALLWDDCMMGIFNAIGEKCCTVDDNGQIELTLMNEKTADIVNKFFTTAFDKSLSYTYQRTSWDGTDAVNMFSNNQALFFLQLLRSAELLRNMNADFGILPYPKYDEAQSEYYCTVGSWHSVFLCVPLTQEDPERTGAIIEALAYESVDTLTPAYYDISLKGKYSRDNESADMLDIIFKSRTYDLGWFYQVGDYNESVMNMLRKFNNNYVSMYETSLSKAQVLIDKINTAFSSIK